tara:strand:+ start:60 stop:512 length:453 start_codon:yes stop_codon:yes gene_type:complete
MRNLIILLIFFFTLNCSINKVSNLHGFSSIDRKVDKIELNKSNKNDVRKIIGPPSSKSTFNDIWLYVERKKTNQSLFKLGKKKISTNNILIIEFSNMGLVKDKTLLNLNDMNHIKIAEKKTQKKFRQDNFVYNILSTLRDKINAPTRQRK